MTALREELRTKSAEYESRFAQLESAQGKSRILSDAVLEPNEEETYTDIQTFASRCNDEGYNRVRDYFLQEMRTMGIHMAENSEDPGNYSQRIEDPETGITLNLFSLYPSGRNNVLIETPYFNPFSSNFGGGEQKEVTFKTLKSRKRPREVLYIHTTRCPQAMLIDGKHSNQENWTRRLINEGLEDFFKALTNSYCITSLKGDGKDDPKDVDIIFGIQKIAGLQNNPAFLDRIKELMKKDKRIAESFTRHFGRAEE